MYERELMKAAREGKKAQVKEYLKNGANVNARDPASYSETPLYHSVSSRSLETVELLLANGADIHLANTKGHTHLYTLPELLVLKKLLLY
jgi:ankyrin repeat protein